MEKSKEKSEEQAQVIFMIAFQIAQLDIEYCKEVAGDMKNQANRQEIMAVLNPNHPRVKNDILREQGNALSLLCQYAESIKQVQALKAKLENENQVRQQINNMFI